MVRVSCFIIYVLFLKLSMHTLTRPYILLQSNKRSYKIVRTYS